MVGGSRRSGMVVGKSRSGVSGVSIRLVVFCGGGFVGLVVEVLLMYGFGEGVFG